MRTLFLAGMVSLVCTSAVAGEDAQTANSTVCLHQTNAAACQQMTGHKAVPFLRIADAGAVEQGRWELDSLFDVRGLLGSTTAPSNAAASPEQVDEALRELLSERERWSRASRDEAGNGREIILAANTDSASKGTTQSDIEAALEALLAERASWGTSPWDNAPKQTAVSGTSNADALKALLEQRAAWGKGKTEPKEEPAIKVAAEDSAQASKLTPVSQEQLRQALEQLLAERASWGDRPSDANGLAVLSTRSVNALLAQREAWGPGPEEKTIAAPLAAGARYPLPISKPRKVAAPTKPPIVHPADNKPVPELTGVSAEKLDAALAKLFAEREAWGSVPSIIDETSPYPTLSTSSLSDLLEQRALWGNGPVVEVEAPKLAAGAKVPLEIKSVRKAAAEADSKPPIVHEAEITPAPKLTAVPQDQIESALKSLLATRASWGTAPSKTPEAYAVLDTQSLKGLLEQRAKWGSAPSNLADTSPLPSSKPKVDSYAVLTTKSVGALLKQREAWGGGAAGDTVTKVAATAPAQTGAISPSGNVGCVERLKSVAGQRRIGFEPSSAVVDGASSKMLDRITSIVNECPTLRIQIEGHTDSRGSAAKNQTLSEARANSVLSYLVNAGADKSRLKAIGYGETKPLVSNSTARNRAKNRRIEFTVITN